MKRDRIGGSRLVETGPNKDATGADPLCPPRCMPSPGTRAYEYLHSPQYELDGRKAAFAEKILTEEQYLGLDGAGLITVEDWLWAFKEMDLLK